MCKKRRFENEHAALFTLSFLQRRGAGRRRLGRCERRAYLCGCGGWHLTSQRCR